LAVLVHKGLAKDPNERYPSIQALLDDLQHQYIEGHGDIICTYSLTRRVGNEFIHFLDAHPKVGFFSAAFALLFALFGVGSALYLLVSRLLA
jgi:hypothetical protein